MNDLFERLARGPKDIQPKDYDNWNEMVGAAPREKFGRATYDAIRNVPQDDYYNHTQPGAQGTDPLGSLDPNQRGGLAGTLLNELMRRGLGQDDIQQNAGVRNLDPRNMSPEDLARLLQYTQREQPKAFGRV